MIIVAGHLRVRPEDRDRFVDLSRRAVRLARATDGCADFAVGADPVEADRVNVFERWRDRASLVAFRGEGPSEELAAMITDARVEELTVVAATGD